MFTGIVRGTKMIECRMECPSLREASAVFHCIENGACLRQVELPLNIRTSSAAVPYDPYETTLGAMKNERG